jgi:hypothetical protein
MARGQSGETHKALYRPWGRVTTKFWMTPAGQTPSDAAMAPEAIRHRLAEIIDAARDTRLEEAFLLATQLDRDSVDQYGEGHMYTVQVREVRGYVAALAGDFAAGVGLYLHTARLRLSIQGPDHPEVEQATLRAYSMWRSMPPNEERSEVGTELLNTVVAIHGPHAPLAREIRDSLWSRMLPPATASSQITVEAHR